ncbi:unnamed protein product, partial [Mycena citricolor]
MPICRDPATGVMLHTTATLPPHPVPTSGARNPSAGSRRNVSRACDACRRRKTKCDGPSLTDHICSLCRIQNKTCTYQEASTPRGPPKAYITNLEDRLERLEVTLAQRHPGVDLTAQLGPPIPRGSWRENPDSVPSSRRRIRNPAIESSPPLTSLRFSTDVLRTIDSDETSSEGTSSEDELDTGLKDERRPYVDNAARFFGESSTMGIAARAGFYRSQHLGVSSGATSGVRRSYFWRPLPWEQEYESRNSPSSDMVDSLLSEFPSPALAQELIELYFNRVNSQLPLLHQPTFERQYNRDQLHKHSPWFTCVCLGVFAIASRWSNNIAVLSPEDADGEQNWTRAGWRFHSAAMRVHNHMPSLFLPPSLEEIQSLSLLSTYLRSSRGNHAVSWIVISLALRKAEDRGIHRRRLYNHEPNAEEELWRRAFWCLVAYDRFGSAILGRPPAVGEDDFDLDPCLEVDDEYWEADPPFTQPKNVPCRITYFNLWTRLSQIVIFTVKTVYSIHNPQALL